MLHSNRPLDFEDARFCSNDLRQELLPDQEEAMQIESRENWFDPKAKNGESKKTKVKAKEAKPETSAVK